MAGSAKVRAVETIQFNDLLTPLANSRIQLNNQPLFQTIAEIIKRSNQNRAIFVSQIIDIQGNLVDLSSTIVTVAAIVELLQDLSILIAEPVVGTILDNFPNARELLPGAGITFDDSVPNERTINASIASSGVLPMVNGEEPPELMSNGVGDLIIIPYSYTP